MNKEKGIYELLPSEPVDVAAMLIKATIVTDAPVFAPLSPMLVYCNAQERGCEYELNDSE